MIRLADILKKYRQGSRRPDASDAGADAKGKLPRLDDTFSVSSAMNKEIDATLALKATQMYQEALARSRELYRPQRDESLDCFAGISAAVTKIIEALSDGNAELLRRALADYESPEDYLSGHAVNVCIMALGLGIGLKFPQQRLLDLGVAAFVHDIGQIEMLALINKKGILTKKEFAAVKEHPARGTSLLGRISTQFSRAVLEVVQQEHERIDGSGYPLGLKEMTVSENAQLVGLVDVYEAMIHERPYRSKYTSLETVKTILNSKATFAPQLVKMLIERIGIFPLGVMVRLNTNEVGMVVKDNIKLPLRPVVNILFDAGGQQLEIPKPIDLAQNTMLFIKECVDCVKKI